MTGDRRSLSSGLRAHGRARARSQEIMEEHSISLGDRRESMGDRGRSLGDHCEIWLSPRLEPPKVDGGLLVGGGRAGAVGGAEACGRRRCLVVHGCEDDGL